MEVLHTLHMDLCGPMRVQIINGKNYILVIVDDYSRFTLSTSRRSGNPRTCCIRNQKTTRSRGKGKGRCNRRASRTFPNRSVKEEKYYGLVYPSKVGTEATALKVDKEQGEEASTTVTSEERMAYRTEDQAGSDPGESSESQPLTEHEKKDED
ncbi:retrovirus-related pol polyprotein from transposon TNT 1-94 [Tanacetum coccineum]